MKAVKKFTTFEELKSYESDTKNSTEHFEKTRSL
jgi:hypothetical protein